MNQADEARVKHLAEEIAKRITAEEIDKIFVELNLIRDIGGRHVRDYDALAEPAHWFKRCTVWRERLTISSITVIVSAIVIAILQAAPDIWTAIKARLWP